MTLPSDYSGLLGWVDATSDPRMRSEDINSPCPVSGNFIRWMPDKVDSGIVWNTQAAGQGGAPGISLADFPSYVGGAMLFNVQPEEQNSFAFRACIAGPDRLITQPTPTLIAASDCGDLESPTVPTKNYSFPTGCWTLFSVFNLDNYISPYPLTSVCDPSIPESIRRTIGRAAITINLQLGDSGIKILYNDTYQQPRLAAISRANVSVIESTTIQTGQKLVVEASNTNGVCCLWKNGQFIGSGPGAGVSQFSTTNTLVLGSGRAADKSDLSGPNYFGDLYIYEAFAYNRVLNQFERDEVRQYLANKWGVSVQASSTGDCEVCGGAGAAGVLKPQATLIGAN